VSDVLTAGFIRKGPAEFTGALRVRPGGAARWECRHKHLTPARAKACGEAELARRSSSPVLERVLCPDDGTLWDEDRSRGCPVCGAAGHLVTVMVLGRA
jgi:hypothetical protein